MRRRTRPGKTLAGFLLLLLAAPASAYALCGSTTFRDGFESGDTSAWTNSPDAPRAGGTWRLVIDFDGSPRAFALELVERADDALIGYVLGGTLFRTVVTGAAGAGTVALELELVSPSATRSIALAGTLDRATMALTASGGVATQAVAAERLYCDLVEQQLVVADLSGGPDPQHLRELSVALDEEGELVAGGFVGLEDCDLWACDGGVTSFADAADVLTIGLETDGGCSTGSSLTAIWAPDAGYFVGSYSFHDCTGSTSGDAAVAYGMATSSAAARDALAGRAEIADLLEAGAPLPAPLPSLVAGYLHFGKDEPALRSELDAELSAYADLEVELLRPRGLATATHPRTLIELERPFGWSVDERRTGIRLGGGPEPVTYRDTAVRPLIDDLGRLDLEGGRWGISGNRVPALELPFDYVVPPGSSRLEAATADGHPVYVSLGPYGGHFQPLTGDPSGEAKANLVGFLVADDGEMEELVGDGDGEREPGETWGYPIGGDPSGDRVRNRRPVYRAPLDAELQRLIYERGPSGVYFDDEPHWRLELLLAGEIGLTLGHVGRIAPPLRALVLASTGIDPQTFSGPPGTDLLAGLAPIPVAANLELALPQVLAGPVPGFPGYFVGGGSFLDHPWAQIEFQLPYRLARSDELGGDFCVYRFMSPVRRSELQATMNLDMLDSQSLRYRDRFFTRRWQWTAEGSLCQAESPLPRDFSSLDTRLGGWYERPAPGTSTDELFAFVAIDRESEVYDPSSYDSSAVDHLAIRSLWPGPYAWPMPDGTTATPSLPVGEVLEWDGASLLIKWRELNATNAVVYQRTAYRLDAAGLQVRWGNFAATAAGALPPTLLPGVPCDDADTLCYDHALGSWPP